MHRTMSVLVSKSQPVVVGPSELTMPISNMNLSSIDILSAGLAPTSILVFDTPIHSPAESIKRALSQALVHYHPIAGRLAVAAKDDELAVACTGEGVLFISASANCTMENHPFMNELVKDLYAPAPGGGWRRDDPFLLMQVTEFSCGRFAVGVTWNHVIADGTGMAQFLQAIAELVRGLPQPSVLPVRCDDSLAGLSRLAAVQKKWLRSLDLVDFASLDITIPWSLISRIRAEFDGEPCTVVEATTAVLWQCRTRVVASNPDAPTLLLFVANMRKHTCTKDGYYGNCVMAQAVSATNGAVANGDIKDLVKLIKGAKEKIPEMCKNAMVDDPTRGLLGYDVWSMSSWRNIGFDAVDFGTGRPARVMMHVPQETIPLCILCPPCKGKDGVNVMSRFVREEHAAAFLREVAKLV